jgi:hypothetical protein
MPFSSAVYCNVYTCILGSLHTSRAYSACQEEAMQGWQLREMRCMLSVSSDRSSRDAFSADVLRLLSLHLCEVTAETPWQGHVDTSLHLDYHGRFCTAR